MKTKLTILMVMLAVTLSAQKVMPVVGSIFDTTIQGNKVNYSLYNMDIQLNARDSLWQQTGFENPNNITSGYVSLMNSTCTINLRKYRVVASGDTIWRNQTERISYYDMFTALNNFYTSVSLKRALKAEIRKTVNKKISQE